MAQSSCIASCVQTIHKGVAGNGQEMAPSGLAKACSLAERAVRIGTQVIAARGPEPAGADVTNAFGSVLGEELGKYALHEYAKAVSRQNSGDAPGLTITPEIAAAKLEDPNRAPEDLLLIASICEYLVAEAIEIANNARQSNAQEVLTAEHFELAIEGDDALMRIFGDAPLGGEAPSACRLLKQDLDSDDLAGGFGPVGYLRWQTIDDAGEIIDTDRFPLERWSCGHYPPGTDHSKRDNDRVNAMVTRASALRSLARRVRCESSDCDSEFQLFTAYSDEEDPIPREKDALAKHLALRLKLDPKYASVLSLPAQEGYEDRLLSPYWCEPMPGEEAFSAIMKELENPFFFRGGDDGGDKGVNTYPVVFGGFLPSGDIAGVFAIRCDT